ncbi:MAG: cell division protein ZapA [Gammaproteobacteria bacterium CG_4_10_14_0_8_um_filter_38_16]|nr:MAG: cell division protein ZapA [Gammaproteobacteria bacterium CG_4_10_14_0_8_um_filter_38_16]PJA03907.1 MAG: cell division protein ZapA [Gammaproteobacteria bacterium CG_4_10_14_0_2_um_filter_38_22]PJB09576.1 MAG: cell division protein ZapA [Gammaproteobacteria bacterium CG_4_9_14_3_um_filter_38_9]
MSSIDHMTAVTILDRTYQIKCPPEEVAKLRESASYLNAEMKKNSQGAQIGSVERLAIVAALNITHELMAFKNQKNAYIDVMHEQIKSLQRRIQKFLETKDEVTV